MFLTPLGDTRGLYVSAKSPRSFTVRETQGGRATLAFDYRIVARPADAKAGRLPAAADAQSNVTQFHSSGREAMAQLHRADAMASELREATKSAGLH